MNRSSSALSGPSVDNVIADLDAKITSLVARIKKHEAWDALTSPNADGLFVRLFMKELYLEIYSYQPQVIEATIAIIGRMPKSAPRMIQTMLIHQAQEADHGEVALQDYVALGGDEQYARTRRISPASFAVASFWWGLYRMESPFCYLGALYLFEGLTPLLCQAVLRPLEKQGFPVDALKFVTFHATEDLKHQAMVRKLLTTATARYPDALQAIRYGLDYFMAVYPIPCYEEAYKRAKHEYGAIMEPKTGRIATRQ